MFNVDQAVRDAETNLSLFISVRAMELKMELQRDFAELRAKRDAEIDTVALLYVPVK